MAAEHQRMLEVCPVWQCPLRRSARRPPDLHRKHPAHSGPVGGDRLRPFGAAGAGAPGCTAAVIPVSCPCFSSARALALAVWRRLRGRDSHGHGHGRGGGGSDGGPHPGQRSVLPARLGSAARAAGDPLRSAAAMQRAWPGAGAGGRDIRVCPAVGAGGQCSHRVGAAARSGASGR